MNTNQSNRQRFRKEGTAISTLVTFFLFATVLVFVVPSTSNAQLSTYFEYDFTDGTACGSEDLTAKNIQPYVASVSNIARNSRLDCGFWTNVCSNPKFFSSTDFRSTSSKSTYDTYSDASKSYVYFEVTLGQNGGNPAYFSRTDGVTLKFKIINHTGGPEKHFIRYRFGTTTYWSAWQESNVIDTIHDCKWALRTFTLIKDSASLNKLRVEIHGFNAPQFDKAWKMDDVSLSGPDPMPVELVSFTSSVIGKSVQLNWKTATEANNYGFEIERSTKGTDWKTIGFVEGHGTVNTPQIYSFIDNNAGASSPKYFYRLKQIDRTGTVDYSPIVEVIFGKINKDFGITTVYPNPFNPSTVINFFLPQKEQVTLKVYDILGKEMTTLYDRENLEAGPHAIMFDASKLASGTYFATLVSSSVRSTQKIILSR